MHTDINALVDKIFDNNELVSGEMMMSRIKPDESVELIFDIDVVEPAISVAA